MRDGRKLPRGLLHHYDRLGLLKPNRYTNSGFRLYGEREFARLQQILTLKFIGFSLKQIKEILNQREFDLAETLHLQRRVIEAQRNQLNLALEAINRAENLFKQNGAIDWESFQKIIEVINMEQNIEWTKKYYSEAAQAKIEERKNLWSQELQERVSREWNELTKDIEVAITDGTKPTDELAQKLAARWSGLVQEFTGGDAEIQSGLNRMYADEANWQTDWQKPFSNEVQDFIFAAMKNNAGR
ncbi:MAG: MerR family transcriptional regulator [Acidobacteria bacterium]|nr:MerR family transcriptional regulator [Acidobacteriota bacterium]MCA1636886.1 MerR family transcriptional regulator [Acidobacteriota bacterium]